MANRLTVRALESEDYIVLSAVTDAGVALDADQARRLFSLTAFTGRVLDSFVAVSYTHLLVSIIDEHAFGDLKSYRNQYARLASDDTFAELKRRLEPICKRTLRRQVLEYIRYTERRAHTQEFIPSPEEDILYDCLLYTSRCV